jgi:hypothetical protein
MPFVGFLLFFSLPVSPPSWNHLPHELLDLIFLSQALLLTGRKVRKSRGRRGNGKHICTWTHKHTHIF